MHFLSNAPLGNDLFEGKSQNSIASAIVEQIKSNAEKDRRSEQQKMIGIEGAWGSGKSNLIEIIKKKLDDEKKFFFFTYDVWGHQEDLQRKAVLNELVDFLIEKKAIKNNEMDGDENNWKERVKKTTGIVTETKQVQIPKISIGIFLYFIILLCLPIFEKIADLKLFENSKWPIVILLIPVGCIVLIFVYRLICKFIEAIVNSIKQRLFNIHPINLCRDCFGELFCVYKDKEIESSNREYVNEMNPSVMDFRKLMKALSDALKNKQLIVFFDNMDRLPKEKVENLWSSIHTFFAENQGYKNISCIVSFDRSHIRNAFDVDGQDGQRGDDYIDKTFDVVFRVAPPVLSDWKNFFKTKWKEAFEDGFDQVEYDCVIQAYSALSDKNSLMPRSIIKFVNDCVLLKRLFNTIPERYIAIFNLRKKDLIDDSLNKKCLGSLQSIYENDSQYDSCIAALVYQVPPERALSAVYVLSLARALEQGNEKELDRISKASFFEVILDDALKSVADLKKAIESLDLIENIPLTKSRQKKLWRDLYLETQSLMQLDSGKMESFQNVLIKHLDVDLKYELAKKILAPYDSVDFTQPRDVYGNTGKEYLAETYVGLLKEIEKNIHRGELKEILHEIRIKPETYITLLKTFDDFDWIPFECNELSSYISYLNYQEILELDCLKKLPKKKRAYLDIGNGLKKVFAQNQIYNEENLLKVFKIMEASPNSKIESNWLNWVSMGLLLNSTQVDELKGFLLAFRLIFSNHPLPGNNPFDAMLKSDISDEINVSMFAFFASLRGYGALISNISLLKTCPIVQKYVQQHFADDSFKIRAGDVFDILPKLEILSQLLEIDMALWISKISNAYFEDEKTIEDLFIIELEGDLNNEYMKKILPYDTIEILGSQPSKLFMELRKRLVAYFNSWDKETWVGKLKNVDLYGVKEAILIKYEWSQNAKEAIEVCLNDCLIDSSCFFDKEVWKQIMNSLDRSFKERIFKNMRDEFYIGRVKMSEKIFVCVGDWLLEYGEIGQIAGDVLRTIVPISLLDNFEVAQMIAKHIDVIQDVLDEENEAKDWLGKIKSLSETQENYPLKEIVKSFNLKL